jgi:GT2 family glycosyltransferase
LTVGVTTQNRPASLRRGLESLTLIRNLTQAVIIFDDGSAPPVASRVTDDLPEWLQEAVRIVRAESPIGQQQGRNRIVEMAKTNVVLLLDDDAFLLDGAGVERGLQILGRDPSVGAIAFAQANADGAPWPAPMQPSRATYACLVPSFIGFAHLIRRDVFLGLGGYRSSFFYHGEEKEFCLRLLDGGHGVVYLPGARVAHVPDPTGRSQRSYVRYVIRNDCLTSLYNDPWWRLLWVLPARLVRYFKMRRQAGLEDPEGFSWLVHELAIALPIVRAERRPLRVSTFKKWRWLRDTSPAYSDSFE